MYYSIRSSLLREDSAIRIFKTKNFARWARKEKLTDDVLKQTIDEMVKGLIGTDLGSGLVKKRVARKGKGKRGGYRTLLAFKQSDRTIYMFGFSKNERENIDEEEKQIYRKLSQFYLKLSRSDLVSLCNEGKLIEVS